MKRVAAGNAGARGSSTRKLIVMSAIRGSASFALLHSCSRTCYLFLRYVNSYTRGEHPDVVTLGDLEHAEVQQRRIVEVLLGHGDAAALPAEVCGNSGHSVRSVLVWQHPYSIGRSVSDGYLSSHWV